jgi:hypothetical protein
MADEQGVGKCAENHLGSYGYATRPPERYGFCPQCGRPMVWACERCSAPLPEDSGELATARFCRECGHSYFNEERPQDGPA